jgi:DNA gyrase subunit B
MTELVENGHVYIAVPPLYRVKLGNQERYIEKESQFEELLVRERLKDLEVLDATGEQVSLTEARWGRFVRALHEFDGWAGRLRSDFGPAIGDFVVERRLVETEAASVDDVEHAFSTLAQDGHEVAVVERGPDGFTVKVVETETSAATYLTVPAEVLSSPVYANVRKAYAKLREIVGRPPYRLTLRKREADAATFSELRDSALGLAKEGMQVSRFKGLGEMNPEELWATTMDPARRMLVRVEVEDAATADLIFSTLMGDQVEPRRVFIEQNAKDVRFLDV